MERSYHTPTLKVFGEVEVLTQALGGASDTDQSAYPQFPADHGSFNVCNGDT